MAVSTPNQIRMARVLVNTKRVVDFINNDGEHLRCEMRDGTRGFFADLYRVVRSGKSLIGHGSSFLGKDQGSADKAWDDRIRIGLMCEGSEDEFKKLIKLRRKPKKKRDSRVLLRNERLLRPSS